MIPALTVLLSLVGGAVAWGLLRVPVEQREAQNAPESVYVPSIEWAGFA